MLRCNSRRRLAQAAGRLLLVQPQQAFTLTRHGLIHQPAAVHARPRQFSYTAVKSQVSSQFSGFPPCDDTIYALSTAQGRAGIAVVRISGVSCLEIYRALCPSKKLPKPRLATVRSLFHPTLPAQDSVEDAVILDAEAIVLYFPAPRTVTGDDVLELHIHGGTATVKAVLAAIAEVPTNGRIRYAEPGEFTKRAFINDRLDLAQIESLSDMLAAETEQQRRAAVRGNSGSLGQTYEKWRNQLLLARGELEALIDFSEDQHFDEPQSELLDSVAAQIDVMLRSILLHERGSQRNELLRNGIRIALLGPPNAGKSSLMNLIVGREASIVSGEAGTTRDIVEASLDIRGYLCSFADTAGFRSIPDNATAVDGTEVVIGAVEKEGIRRAKQKAQESDVVVVMASVESRNGTPFIHYDEETLKLATEAGAYLVVVNKQDTVDPSTLTTMIRVFREEIMAKSDKLTAVVPLPISCKEAAAGSLRDTDPGGVQTIIDALVNTFTELTVMPADQQDLLGVTERQRQLLVKCRRHLEEFMMESLASQDGEEPDAVLAAEYLRYAADCLARITGKGEAGDVEDVLGVVFEKFCVGK